VQRSSLLIRELTWDEVRKIQFALRLELESLGQPTPPNRGISRRAQGCGHVLKAEHAAQWEYGAGAPKDIFMAHLKTGAVNSHANRSKNITGRSRNGATVANEKVLTSQIECHILPLRIRILEVLQSRMCKDLHSGCATKFLTSRCRIVRAMRQNRGMRGGRLIQNAA
jgi:hypothetical protein